MWNVYSVSLARDPGFQGERETEITLIFMEIII